MATDFSKPLVTDAYATLLPGVVEAHKDLAMMLEPTLTGASTNVPTGAVRWNAATVRFERYNGTSWVTLPTAGDNVYAISISGGWSAIPSGTRMPFAQAAAPTGWTQDTTDAATNRMLRVVNTAGGAMGGSHSPILNNVVPSHSHGYSGTSAGQSADHAHYTSGTSAGMSANASHGHTVSDPGHAHSYNQATGGTSKPNGGGTVPFTDSTASTSGGSGTGISISGTNTDHTHTWGGWSGGVNAGHSHTYSGTTDNGSSATNWAPRYIDMIICAKV